MLQPTAPAFSVRIVTDKGDRFFGRRTVSSELAPGDVCDAYALVFETAKKLASEHPGAVVTTCPVWDSSAKRYSYSDVVEIRAPHVGPDGIAGVYRVTERSKSDVCVEVTAGREVWIHQQRVTFGF